MEFAGVFDIYRTYADTLQAVPTLGLTTTHSVHGLISA
jgi:hypothetical protein